MEKLDAVRYGTYHEGKPESEQPIMLSDMVQVALYFEKSFHPSTYLMRKQDVEMFFEATIKLHYSPGVNPASKEPTVHVYKIEARTLKLDTEPYWWSMPSLGEGDSREGARIIREDEPYKLWRSPEQIARDEATDALD